MQEEISGVNGRLSELLQHIKELGSRVHDVESSITDSTTVLTVLKGHEEDIFKLQREVAILNDKTEDLSLLAQ